MAIKINLEKAYDKLEWSFIRDMLWRINLLGGLIGLIMSCVSSVSTSILFHLKNLEFIFPRTWIEIQGSHCVIFLGLLPYHGQDYLGIPIKQPDTSLQDFNFILDSVKQKLAGWKANLLSLARRAVLIQASSSTIVLCHAMLLSPWENS